MHDIGLMHRNALDPRPACPKPNLLLFNSTNPLPSAPHIPPDAGGSSGKGKHGPKPTPVAAPTGPPFGDHHQRLVANINESVLLNCELEYPNGGMPVPYVIQWKKLDVKIPIFIWSVQAFFVVSVVLSLSKKQA